MLGVAVWVKHCTNVALLLLVPGVTHSGLSEVAGDGEEERRERQKL